ncbi:MAG: HPF/RaiA family ribosome-associated protein [Planctomycetota bacterium]
MLIQIVDRNETLDESMREFAKKRLLFALSRFGRRVQRVRAVLSDVNGPKGGVDKSCRVTVKLLRLPDVCVSNEDLDARACFSRAADRVGRAVARTIEREQHFERRRPFSSADSL